MPSASDSVPFAAKVGCTPQTLHDCVRKAEIDSGHRAGVPTDIAELADDGIKALVRIRQGMSIESIERYRRLSSLRRATSSIAGELSPATNGIRRTGDRRAGAGREIEHMLAGHEPVGPKHGRQKHARNVGEGVIVTGRTYGV
ncbi:hypothetical protein LMTR13_12495 [Bradyrhizobium icense]|uniref:Transposase n=1 Tax=Bradyrhizobium icense TaxID=1274631 RepID=A0A1B1UDP4_9BRAD|nr:hypothetical protein LMTR13_12495 [Bradyrhizobium icense]